VAGRGSMTVIVRPMSSLWTDKIVSATGELGLWEAQHSRTAHCLGYILHNRSNGVHGKVVLDRGTGENENNDQPTTHDDDTVLFGYLYFQMGTSQTKRSSAYSSIPEGTTTPHNSSRISDKTTECLHIFNKEHQQFLTRHTGAYGYVYPSKYSYFG
jgi:hypothetical protein